METAKYCKNHKLFSRGLSAISSSLFLFVLDTSVDQNSLINIISSATNTLWQMSGIHSDRSAERKRVMKRQRQQIFCTSSSHVRIQRDIKSRLWQTGLRLTFGEEKKKIRRGSDWLTRHTWALLRAVWNQWNQEAGWKEQLSGLDTQTVSSV